MKKYDKNSWWTHGSCRIHNEIKTAQKLFLKYVWVSKSKLKMRRNLPFCDLIQKCNPTLRSHSPLAITSFQADLRKLQNKDNLILASATVAMWRQIIQDTNVTSVASLVDNVLKHTEVENLLKLFAYDIYSPGCNCHRSSHRVLKPCPSLPCPVFPLLSWSLRWTTLTWIIEPTLFIWGFGFVAAASF